MLKIGEPRRYGWFLDRVETASDRLLLSDYDGALAPFSIQREQSHPYEGLPGLLKGLMNCRTRVIVISDRPSHEVAALLGMESPPEIWGNDGLERLFPDGRYECGDLNTPIEVLQALAECERTLEREGLKSWIQVKLSGVAVRWRGLTPSEKLDIRIKAYRVLQPLTLLHKGLRLVALEEGFELRLPVTSKTEAVRYLLNTTPPDVPVAYLGHNVVDEDLFRALNGRGLTVLVRKAPRFSAAQLCLKPPQELADFLRDWISACGGPIGAVD